MACKMVGTISSSFLEGGDAGAGPAGRPCPVLAQVGRLTLEAAGGPTRWVWRREEFGY